MKKLTSEANKILSVTGQRRSPETLFLAILSLLTIQVTQAVPYWAYYPDPPFLQILSWVSPYHLKVYTNRSDLLGGLGEIPQEHKVSQAINFTGLSDHAPLCFHTGNSLFPQCAQLMYRSLLTDGPWSSSDSQNRNMWQPTLMIIAFSADTMQIVSVNSSLSLRLLTYVS